MADQLLFMVKSLSISLEVKKGFWKKGSSPPCPSKAPIYVLRRGIYYSKSSLLIQVVVEKVH
jgi:hypothetical protein